MTHPKTGAMIRSALLGLGLIAVLAAGACTVEQHGDVDQATEELSVAQVSEASRRLC